MKEPQKPKGQLVRLIILVVVASGTVTLYGLIVSILLGLGISGEVLAILAVCGAGIGLFAWALLSLP